MLEIAINLEGACVGRGFVDRRGAVPLNRADRFGEESIGEPNRASFGSREILV